MISQIYHNIHKLNRSILTIKQSSLRCNYRGCLIKEAIIDQSTISTPWQHCIWTRKDSIIFVAYRSRRISSHIELSDKLQKIEFANMTVMPDIRQHCHRDLYQWCWCISPGLIIMLPHTCCLWHFTCLINVYIMSASVPMITSRLPLLKLNSCKNITLHHRFAANTTCCWNHYFR